MQTTEITVTPYDLKLILIALDYTSSYYNGEESISDMAQLSHTLQSKYGWGTDEGKDKYNEEG